MKSTHVSGTWHTFHVPLTWVLFIAAFIHVVAALYYATLQR
jgi:cytochrome b561